MSPSKIVEKSEEITDSEKEYIESQLYEIFAKYFVHSEPKEK